MADVGSFLTRKANNLAEIGMLALTNMGGGGGRIN